MVECRDGAGGRPFALIFAVRMPLHDIVLQVPSPPITAALAWRRNILLQFYHDVSLRQRQYPQSPDLASKMDNMYRKWWEFLQEFVENGGAPFIDAVVLQRIAAHCANVRPQLQVPMNSKPCSCCTRASISLLRMTPSVS